VAVAHVERFAGAAVTDIAAGAAAGISVGHV
jgi:hypothetical protein